MASNNVLVLDVGDLRYEEGNESINDEEHDGETAERVLPSVSEEKQDHQLKCDIFQKTSST